jgi:hypothetical protein
MRLPTLIFLSASLSWSCTNNATVTTNGVTSTYKCSIVFDATNPAGQANNRRMDELIPNYLTASSYADISINLKGVGWTYANTAGIDNDSWAISQAAMGRLVLSAYPTTYSAYMQGTSVSAGSSTAMTMSGLGSGGSSYIPGCTTCSCPGGTCTYTSTVVAIVDLNTASAEVMNFLPASFSGAGKLTWTPATSWANNHTTPNVIVPAWTYPAQENDVAALLAWCAQNCAALGGNPNRIHLGGWSSGTAEALDVIGSALKTTFLNNANCAALSWWGATYGATCSSSNVNTAWTVVSWDGVSQVLSYSYMCDNGANCVNVTAKVGCNPSTTGGTTGCKTYSQTIEPDAFAAQLRANSVNPLIQIGTSDPTTPPGQLPTWQALFNSSESNGALWIGGNHGIIGTDGKVCSPGSTVPSVSEGCSVLLLNHQVQRGSAAPGSGN